jgi:hypothetical protein
MSIGRSMKDNQRISDVKAILNYLHTYPEILKKLDMEDLLFPNEVVDHYESWLKIVSEYTGKEKAFFKPYWLPINRSTFSYFIDISSPNYSIISYHILLPGFHNYGKSVLFHNIKELLLFKEQNLNLEGIYEEYKDRTSFSFGFDLDLD